MTIFFHLDFNCQITVGLDLDQLQITFTLFGFSGKNRHYFCSGKNTQKKKYLQQVIVNFIVSHGVINQKNVSNTFASFKIQNNEAAVYRYSIKNCSDKFRKNSSENTYTRVSFFIRTQAFYTEKRIRHTFLKNTSIRQFLSYLFLYLGNIK